MYKEYTIDKSLLTAEELEQYEALVAKATVNPEANEEEVEEEKPPFPPKKKSAKPTKKEDDEPVVEKSAPEESPVIKAAMEELANLKKSYEMDKMLEVAKKYAPLGKNEKELAQTLHSMKETSEDVYKSYIAILDESLNLVEKSGLFSEIGKSAGNGPAANGAVAKVEAKAREIQKSDATISWDAAIAKAWQDPALIAEYDAEYFG